MVRCNARPRRRLRKSRVRFACHSRPRDGSACGFLPSTREKGSYQMADATNKGMFEEQSVRSFKTEERRVIFASSLGTVFEWYDFYLYAVLAPFFAALFFPPGNDTAALLSAFATYAAGFVVRPFGALVFGRIGDLAGLPGNHRCDGRVDLSRRPAAELRQHWLAGAFAAGHAASAAGPRRRRRIWRRRDLRGRACASWRTRLCDELDSDHCNARTGVCP